MSAFPPIHSPKSVPVSPSIALQRLQAYLEATNSNPSLLPNATLQPDGPKAQSESSSNLVIHNLKRVEAGLRGEWLAPSLDLEGEGMAGVVGAVPIVGGEAMDTTEEGNGEGWQDLEEYQREQSIEGGEIEPRQTGIGQEGDEAVPVVIEVENDAAAEAQRKRERKLAKKERANKEKKQKHLKTNASK